MISELKTFKKKPIINKALQWDGDTNTLYHFNVEWEELPEAELKIKTRTGMAEIKKGDYLVQELDGIGFYPCPKDVFEKSYDLN